MGVVHCTLDDFSHTLFMLTLLNFKPCLNDNMFYHLFS